MDQFTALYLALDRAKGTNAKVEAMVTYFRDAPPEDAAWAVALLCGNRRFRRPVTGTLLRRLAADVTGLPAWLIGESYSVVGDLSETLALVLPEQIEVPETAPAAAGRAAGDVSGDVPADTDAGRHAVNHEISGRQSERLSTSGATMSLQSLIEDHTLPLAAMTDEQRAAAIRVMWQRLSSPQQRLVWHKIMLGSLRVGVAEKNVARALSEIAGTDPAEMAFRMSGHWVPSAEHYLSVVSADASAHVGSGPAGDAAVRDSSNSPRATGPYPFFLAYQVDEPPSDERLGSVEAWVAEWKFDGIRAQIIRRDDGVMMWSRGDELITEAFPEIAIAAESLPPGTVLDGELLAWEKGRPLPFSLLQRRLNRKRVELMLWDDVPVAFIVFDLLEVEGQDLRETMLSERRRQLRSIVAELPADSKIIMADPIEITSWTQLAHLRAESRDRGVEGLMLKRKESAYGVGRRKGDWWKWKVDPFTVDCVLMAAQRGHGRRAGLYTDFTFGVWDVSNASHDHAESEGSHGTWPANASATLVPVTKAYSGLTDDEFREVNRFIRSHTIGEHGPYRTVEPHLVFEIAFEGIQASNRHKSGIALRFPRMLRLRTDKRAEAADTLQAMQDLLGQLERREERS
ncbi:MAG: ATP-dependent DNA ligase [Planctomycetota bacterium]